MTSCCQPHPMPWNGATDAIVRCQGVSTACGRKRRSVRVWHWIGGVKRTPKAVNTPLPPFIVHELDKPGSSATVSVFWSIFDPKLSEMLASTGEEKTMIQGVFHGYACNGKGKQRGHGMRLLSRCCAWLGV